jgi:dihydroneopterin aldolase
MCLADATEEDVAILRNYGAFNRGLTNYVTTTRVKNQELASEYITKHQLEGTLAGRLLVDAKGQHKDLKSAERKRLAEAVEYEEVSNEQRATSNKEEKVRKIDIYSKL